MSTAYLLLGSNLGNRAFYLARAKEWVIQYVGEIIEESSIYESEPWGFETKDHFLNQVIIVSTSRRPDDLLDVLKHIERQMGREIKKEGKGYHSRIIDIDILFYGSMVYSGELLEIPHRHLHNRRFTLTPLVEIAPDFIHPVFQKSLKVLLDLCEDPLQVQKAVV